MNYLINNQVMPLKRCYRSTFHKGDDCALCGVTLTNRKKASETDCNHQFHTKCIKDWLRSYSTCPICGGVAIDWASEIMKLKWTSKSDEESILEALAPPIFLISQKQAS